MTRIGPMDAWSTFRTTSQIQQDRVVSPSLGPTMNLQSLSPDGDLGMVVEWRPSGYTLCRGAAECGFDTTWISPRHSMMDRTPRSVGLAEYTAGPIDLLGGMANDIREARQFWEVSRIYNCAGGFC